MLQALFAETGPHGRAAVTAVGGFVFDQSNLERFAADWAPRVAGLSKPFCSASCYEGLAPFDPPEWSLARRHGLLDELAVLTAKTMLAGFVVATSVDDYREYLEMNPGAAKLIDCPYTLCVLGVLALARHWAERHSRSESIHYWFESGAAHEKEAWEFVRRITLIPKMADQFRIASYSWIPRIAAPALCSADLLVWEWQQRFINEPKNRTDHIDILRRNEARPLYTEYLTAIKISHSALFNLVRQQYFG